MMSSAPSAALRLSLLAIAAAGAAAAGSGATPTAGETEGQLRQRLLQNYGDRATRPGEAAYSLNGLDTCAATIPAEDVEVQLYIESYQPIDSQKETWGFVAYTRVWWNDVRLSYNGTADGGCTDERKPRSGSSPCLSLILCSIPRVDSAPRPGGLGQDLGARLLLGEGEEDRSARGE